MSIATIFSRACAGISAPLVTVEVHLIHDELTRFNIVGLPEAAVRESRERVRSAIINSGFIFPELIIIVNLAPADLPKEGGRFDLAIAMGILAASGQVAIAGLADYEFIGELGLSGEIRGVRGVLPNVLHAKQAARKCIVPYINSAEASLITEGCVYVAKTLSEVCAHFVSNLTLPMAEMSDEYFSPPSPLDMSDVKGQIQAKRALQVAAAGRHSMLLIGPPGTGKTMLASRIAGLLPPLIEAEAIEVAAIASVSSSGFIPALWQQIPFRSPHHTTSSVALVGGGRSPKPGEISLAHRGILFLDELPEYGRLVLEALREPLESGVICISRASFQVSFPAKFQLIAAMNPCPCGYAGSPTQQCNCHPDKICRYLGRLSGPLLDRIDMQIEVPALPLEVLSQTLEAETTQVTRQAVLAAQQKQWQRQGRSNAELSSKDIERFCHLDAASENILAMMMKRYQLSARVYHKILKVARTVADLNDSDNIELPHIQETMQFRALDKLKQSLVR
jgi:magnesium chelatase family protein